MRYYYLLLCLLFSTVAVAQEMQTKKLAVIDTVVIDKISINPEGFNITTKEGKVLDSTYYKANFGEGKVMLSRKRILSDSIIISYRKYPEWLTRKYAQFDTNSIVNSTGNLDKILRLTRERDKPTFVPFQGLNTSGSIVRGVTTGNNQNSVLNSELDLQISGKLSDKVSLRASIQDANIPSQQGGYSQNLDEFDQIFIELYSDDWNIRAGDINLSDSESYFAPFTKKIQGLSLQANINHEEDSKTTVFAAGALVRGVFNTSTFTGQEGNQGPYKLTGANGELFILVVSGSEQVYVNGIAIERGESKDYVIDYNAGELRFNPTFPITSEMRITVDYQFTERRFTRFVTYGGGRYTKNDNISIAAHIYSESDAKNQQLQQTLSREQVSILGDAGDNPEQMIAQSAIPSSFNANSVLYRKTEISGIEVFEFSTNPDEELFTVNFTNVGVNQGDYILSTTNTLQRTFMYVSPINGVRQGSFAPQTRLFAPTLLQLAVVNGAYTPSKSTTIKAEFAGSKNDLNLFSDIDDKDNNGFASHLEIKQAIFTKDTISNLDAFINWDYVQEDFVNIERLYKPEFNRDWNLDENLSNNNGLLIGNQSFLTGGLAYRNQHLGNLTYTFENLDFNGFYTGSRHSFNSLIRSKKIKAQINTSTLTTDDINFTSDFYRISSVGIYDLKKKWIGAKYYAENNKRVAKASDSLTADSQRFNSYEVFTGVGDSTKVYAEVGYKYRINDSLRANQLQRVNTSQTYFIKSQLLQTKNTSIGLFINYRTLNFEQATQKKENSLNSRLLYNQSFAKDIIHLNTTFETNSGTQPQQEFTFVAIDEGQGTHTWNDYNDDGIQQLNEFEISQFQDEADFIRVLLPNQVFIRTHQNRLSSQLTLNPQQWNGQKGIKKFLSRFYYLTNYSIDKRILRDGQSFSINPFQKDQNELNLGLSFRNALSFNRGKQLYTTTYSYLVNQSTNLLSTGLQSVNLESHQLNFLHKIKKDWVFNVKGISSNTLNTSENFQTRNFRLGSSSFNPEISHLFSKQSRLSFSYTYQSKKNKLGDLESLQQNNFGMAFAVADIEKLSLNGGLNYIDNRFRGSAFSPVSYQILEGLQPGTNFTWNLIAQKRITKFLDLNVSYFGRKSDGSSTIHTGNIQFKAFF